MKVMKTNRLYFLAAIFLALFTAGCGSEDQKVDFDLRFIDNMTAHHEGALDMARDAEQKLTRPELKEFARQIVSDQTKEIEQMRALRDQWYKGAPSAESDDIPGMEMHHSSGGSDPDLSFIEMMIPHHQGAIEMANEALQKAKHQEIKQLAQNIITAQQAEIQKMEQWKVTWQKR